MQKEIKVFSAFNGMGCIGLAFTEMGIKFKLYTSEIDKHATKVNDALFPDSINLGDITKIEPSKLPIFDLFVGGSPCQGFSFAGKQLNFDDPRSKLFFNFVNLLNYCKSKNPKLVWLLENVKMERECESIISRYVGIDPIEINSSLLSAQNRKRLYWTNIGTKKTNLFGMEEPGILQPKDEGVFLKDILQREVDEKYLMKNEWSESVLKEMQGKDFLKISKKGKVKSNQNKASCFTAGGNSGGNHSDMNLIAQRPHGFNKGGLFEKKSPIITSSSWQNNNCVIQLNPSKESNGTQPYQHNRVYSKDGKAPTLSCDNRKNILDQYTIRRLTPTECCRLQTIPAWAIDIILNCGVSDSQIYKMLGNGWTVKVIQYILSHHFK